MEELAAALPQVAFNRYPDPAARKLCQAFAAYYGVPAENVAAGNGSDELITVLFTGFLQKGEAFATLEPDFSMYAFNGYLQEARHVPIPKGEDYAIDVDSTVETCQREGVRLLIFSNPGNPTSIVCPREEVRRLIRGLPDTLVVLDEAYMVSPIKACCRSSKSTAICLSCAPAPRPSVWRGCGWASPWAGKNWWTR